MIHFTLSGLALNHCIVLAEIIFIRPSIWLSWMYAYFESFTIYRHAILSCISCGVENSFHFDYSIISIIIIICYLTYMGLSN